MPSIRGGIPIVGHLTLAEFVLFLGCVAAAILGLWMVLGLAPIFKGFDSPGSGGSAQQLLVMGFGPALLISVVAVIGGVVGAIAVVIAGGKRRRRTGGTGNDDAN